MVYPGTHTAIPRQNPRGAYYENLIITQPVKLQGVGPGSPDGSVRGSIIDGGAFGGDTPVADAWYARIGGLTWDGNQTIYEGAVDLVFLPSTGTNAFPTAYAAITAPSIDGFDLRGGDQQGFPGNINEIGGGPTGLPGRRRSPRAARSSPTPTPATCRSPTTWCRTTAAPTARIRIGTPDLPGPTPDNHNENVRIANNRIIANGGTNLAGGIGLFAGADSYEVAGNDICGNFSAEYGGGISVYGYSPNGQIHHNRIYFNRSYDEGGGIMIAGAAAGRPGDPFARHPARSTSTTT